MVVPLEATADGSYSPAVTHTSRAVQLRTGGGHPVVVVVEGGGEVDCGGGEHDSTQRRESSKAMDGRGAGWSG